MDARDVMKIMARYSEGSYAPFHCLILCDGMYRKPKQLLDKRTYIIGLPDHWQSCLMDSGVLYFFCSNGWEPDECILELVPNGTTVQYSKHNYQHFNEISCGLHATSFASHMSMGIEFKEYLKMLDQMEDPDLYVRQSASFLHGFTLESPRKFWKHYWRSNCSVCRISICERHANYLVGREPLKSAAAKK